MRSWLFIFHSAGNIVIAYIVHNHSIEKYSQRIRWVYHSNLATGKSIFTFMQISVIGGIKLAV